jgi:hypothetical protein
LNDRTPYCYRICWTEQNKWYYGRRTAKGCHPNEFWISYFTSSKIVRKFRDKYGEPDHIKITKIFDNIDDCKIWEEKFLTKIDARNNSKFLNRINSDHKLNPINTGPCSNARRLSISYSRKRTKKIKCPHCLKSYDPGNYKRFHGNNCRDNPKIDQNILIERSDKNRKSALKSIKKGTHKHKSPISYGKLKCPHCNKIGKNIGAMKRFHYDKCPSKTGNSHEKFIPEVCCIYCKNDINLGLLKMNHSLCHLKSD